MRSMLQSLSRRLTVRDLEELHRQLAADIAYLSRQLADKRERAARSKEYRRRRRPPPSLSAGARRMRRNALIMRLWRGGLSQAEIAARPDVKLSRCWVNRIIARESVRLSSDLDLRNRPPP